MALYVVVSSLTLLFLTNMPLVNHLSFSYLEYKIRLLRLGLSFQKQNFLYSNSQSGVIAITPKSQLWMGDRNAFSNRQSC